MEKLGEIGAVLSIAGVAMILFVMILGIYEWREKRGQVIRAKKHKSGYRFK